MDKKDTQPQNGTINEQDLDKSLAFIQSLIKESSKCSIISSQQQATVNQLNLTIHEQQKKKESSLENKEETKITNIQQDQSKENQDLEQVELQKMQNQLKEKIREKKNEIKSTNLTEQDQKLIDQIFTRRDDDARKELKEIDFEVDFGSHNFQKMFYAKYIISKPKGIKTEIEKQQKHVIKVPLTRQNYVYVTRAQMDELLSKFKQVYQSFCYLKSYLTNDSIQKFDEVFDFEIFVIIEEEIPERLELSESPNSFEIKWIYQQKQPDNQSNNLNNFIDEEDEIGAKEYFRTYLISMFRPSIFNIVKTLTSIYDLPKEKIVALIVKENMEMFQFLLKYEKMRHTSNLIFNCIFSSGQKSNQTKI